MVKSRSRYRLSLARRVTLVNYRYVLPKCRRKLLFDRVVFLLGKLSCGSLNVTCCHDLHLALASARHIASLSRKTACRWLVRTSRKIIFLPNSRRHDTHRSRILHDTTRSNCRTVKRSGFCTHECIAARGKARTGWYRNWIARYRGAV
ncbi:hypothetical protein D3C72_1800210 [compost metagenome]